MSRTHHRTQPAAALLALLFCCAPARASSPESTVVVVNARSPESLQVANAWIRMRGIPATNVVHLDGVPDQPVIPVAAFRERIWAPVQAWLTAEGIAERIDLIVYSVGFPYGVDFAADAAAQGFEIRPPISPTASLTGLTFLGPLVERGDARAYLDLRANRWFRAPAVAVGGESETEPPGPATPTEGFRSRLSATPDGGDRHVLAAMLGYVGPNGSTVEQVLAYLERAAAVDGTRPAGTFYLLENDDVRANTREPLFASAIADLRAAGFRAEILTEGRDAQDGVLPRGRDDVLGVVAGVASFDWSGSGSTMQAGALAEHLTSFGAQFGTKGQTKCVRFLEAGAAGTCGTVAEPYAVQPKFPVPHLHVHYARGASMAEAMYLSIQGPYQTLVLGDPLARPFAALAEVRLADPPTRRAWRGLVDVQTEVDPRENRDIEQIELWVDGRFVAEAAPEVGIPWDTTTAADGHHELRLVAVGTAPLRSRSSSPPVAVEVRNGRATVTAKARNDRVGIDGELTVSGTARGCARIEIRRGTQVLATVEHRTSFRVAIPAAPLGLGAVTLHARGTTADGAVVLGAPFDVAVEPPRDR